MVSLTRFAVMLSTAALAIAADNPIKTPGWGNVVNAGNRVQIQWVPTTHGNVNIVLREGSQQNLKTVDTITSNYPNTGTFLWETPRDINTNTDYSIEIQDATDTKNSNFSPYFTILAVGEGITPKPKPSAKPSATGDSKKKASASSQPSSTTTVETSSASSSNAKKNIPKATSVKNKKLQTSKAHFVKKPPVATATGSPPSSSEVTSSATDTTASATSSSTATSTESEVTGAAVINHPHALAFGVGALAFGLL
ncbi:hypothetical protein TRICI_002167 [Trichomonascus ciferrii]|uniref:Yeast cell wall synthesis Kre9/Knh1-like N-terminal domain-containing protein n=1 Tax=Trichomonascus ciferrii TaxID=44093 RepID=A0A642V7J2_9ASCO|nr:hypothetical protein TRICI_002167 [Trichomonascus ciferrii]